MTVTKMTITMATTTPITQYGGDGSVGPPPAVEKKGKIFEILKLKKFKYDKYIQRTPILKREHSI